jgi:hypothetical protein
MVLNNSHKHNLDEVENDNEVFSGRNAVPAFKCD